MLRKTALTLSAFFLLSGGAAMAQESVNVRSGEHSDYTRLVFDWPETVGYDVRQQSGTQLVIRFNEESTLNFRQVDLAENSNIRELQTSSDDSSITLNLDIVDGATFRHFLIGTKVVLDVIAKKPGSSPQPTAKVSIPTPPAVKVAEVQKPEPVPEAKMDEDEGETEETVVAEEKTPETAAEEKQEMVKPDLAKAVRPELPEETNLEKIRPDIEAHVVTFSTTESVGMAAFERYGWLWLVADRAELNVVPQIAGPQKGLFVNAKGENGFDKVELKGGVAFRTKLPEGTDLNLYGEGGGLVWRIVVSPKERDKQPAKLERIYVRNNNIRGGTVFWPMANTTKVLNITDPSVGDVIKVVTVEQTDQFTGQDKMFVDFEALNTPIGVAIRPKVDDLDVTLTGNGVQVTRPGGLAISRTGDINRSVMRRDINSDLDDETEDIVAGGEKDIKRIFDFDRWMMGGLQALTENQRILLTNMKNKSKNGKVQDLLAMAKMNIANDRGQEALGFLTYAEEEMPAIADGPEFLALRGAAYALSAKFEQAFQDLYSTPLKDYTELDYWRAYTLAGLEDWRQAEKIMPSDFSVLVTYPKALLEKVGLKLAEVALRGGDVETTEGIIAVLQKDRDTLRSWTIAGMDYLKGEAHRQSGEYDLAKDWWHPLSVGKDDWYRAKAGLALTLLELENADIDYDQAIDRLEGLRYAWRGDELEAKVNYTLGRLYIDKNRYMKGFTILRDAAGMSPESDVGGEITAYMADKFTDILLNNEELTALDAVTLYEEFLELTPSGNEGNLLIQKLAERLVEADLLDRATTILQHQVDYRLEGLEKGRVALRLGVIYLLDKNPRPGLEALKAAREIYIAGLEGKARDDKVREIDLLYARGLSQINHTEEAIEMLNKMEPNPDINRLRADIAWQSGLWEDAAEALQDLVLDEALDLNRPLTQNQADLILNRSVALNLAGNRVELANMRKRYNESMKKTSRARLFDVVTRPRKSSVLSDRATIEALVEEVDMFEQFLETYRNSTISN